MSLFVLINLVVGFLATAIGFGDFAGLPNQVVFFARLLSGVCLLLVVAYLISSVSPAGRSHKRGKREHRPNSRPLR